MQNQGKKHRTLVCTIVSRNYIHFARTLMNSVRAAHPDWEPYVLLVDEFGHGIDRGGESFALLNVAELDLPQPEKFLFRYTILELNTAVKPWLLQWLVEKRAADRVIYLDPDIFVYRPLHEVEAALDGGAFLVLTPHLTAPVDDDNKPNEKDILRAGSFNLGFLALSRKPQLPAFLQWWQKRLEFNCRVAFAEGLFVDQKWIDLAPCLYEDIAILKHPGYNVAYWNLVQRTVTRHPEGYRVNSQPLAFFHFSGLNILAPENLSKYQNRFTMHDLGDGQKLIEDYCASVLGNGYAALSQIPYAFGFFEDGKPILDDMRQAYRTSADIQEKLGLNPFATGSCYPWELPGRLDLDWRRQKFGRVRRMLRPAVRLFPASWRHQVKTALKQILFRPPRETGAPVPSFTPRRRSGGKDTGKRLGKFLPGLNLVGYVRSEHGIGESARLCAMSAEAARLPFSLFDFNVGNNSRTAITDWDHKISPANPHQVNIFHINADQMPLAWQHLGEDFFAGHYNVGFWHWELPEFPEAWTPSFQLVDEIWAPTVFVQEALSRKSPVPVVRMPHAVRFSVRKGLRRCDRGLPEGVFLFLTMYDTHSVQMRKNPRAAIAAFQKAFPNSAEVGLVVKINNPTSYPEEMRQLRASLRSIRGVHVIDHIMSRQEVYDLEALCDCYVSLHRSEGFGLGLAESMYLGKPVIGTNWSGNVDFMRVDNSCPVHYNLIPLDRDYGPYGKGQVWADPDVDQAAWYMRRLVEDAAWRKFLASRGQQTIHTQFSPEAVGALYRQRLAAIDRLIGINQGRARPAA